MDNSSNGYGFNLHKPLTGHRIYIYSAFTNTEVLLHPSVWSSVSECPEAGCYYQIRTLVHHMLTYDRILQKELNAESSCIYVRCLKTLCCIYASISVVFRLQHLDILHHPGHGYRRPSTHLFVDTSFNFFKLNFILLNERRTFESRTTLERFQPMFCRGYTFIIVNANKKVRILQL